MLLQDKGGPAVLPSEVDYLDLLTGAEDEQERAKGVAGEMEPDEEDREMYAELRRQEKQALVDKILKAKAQAQQAKQQQQQKMAGGGGGGAGAMAPNKGQPSPYIQRKVCRGVLLYSGRAVKGCSDGEPFY